MKKLLFLLLLCPFMAMAEFLPGTLTFNDGSDKTGFIEVAVADSKKIKFRATEKGDTEKFSINEIKSYTITTKDKRTITYLTLNLAEPKAFYKGYKIDDQKSWVRIEKAGELNIVSAFYIGSGGSGYLYYIHKPWENHCYYITSDYGGITVSMGEFNAIQKYSAVIFKEDCPKLAESLTKEDYKKSGLNILIDNYAKYCKTK
jgi:hypothetical protein